MDKIFRANDIRGVYPSEINEAKVLDIGRALAEYFSGVIAVAYDTRHSSLSLYGKLIEGLKSNDSLKIIEIGLATTPTLYFLVSSWRLAGGVMVTASHGPKNHNGLKVVGREAISLGGEGVYRIINGSERAPEFNFSGKLTSQEPIAAYTDYLKSKFNLKKPIKIVVDSSDGTASFIFKKILPVKNLEVIFINSEPNGDFPAHGPNPLEEGAIDQLADKAIKNGADLGVAFDADGDRAFFIDDLGCRLTSAESAALLSSQFKSEVVADLVIGRALGDFLRRQERLLIESRVGSLFIKEEMRRCQADFGAEYSGHFYFKDFNYNDSGIMAVILMANYLAVGDEPLSAARASVGGYHGLMINLPLSRELVDKNMSNLKNLFKSQAVSISELDGLKVDFSDWWFNIRPSNTEDLVRINLEAASEELLRQKTEEIKNLIEK